MQRGGGRSACDLDRTRFAISLDPPTMGGLHGRSMADPLNCVAYSQPEPEQLPQKSYSIIASLHTPHGPLQQLKQAMDRLALKLTPTSGI